MELNRLSDTSNIDASFNSTSVIGNFLNKLPLSPRFSRKCEDKKSLNFKEIAGQSINASKEKLLKRKASTSQSSASNVPKEEKEFIIFKRPALNLLQENVEQKIVSLEHQLFQVGEIGRCARDESLKKVISVNEKNQIVLKIHDKSLITNIDSDVFIEYLKRADQLEDNKVFDIEFAPNKKIIFRNKISKKREDFLVQTKVRLYYWDKEIKIGRGGEVDVYGIIRISSNHEKALKEVREIRFNASLEAQKKMLEMLHEGIPADTGYGLNGTEHLGILDACSFSKIGLKDEKSYTVGPLFEGNGSQLKISELLKEAEESKISRLSAILVVIFQLAFGTRVLNHMNVFHHDLKMGNTLFKYCDMEDKDLFPFFVKIVISDIGTQCRQSVEEDYQQKKFNIKFPLGIYTPEYMPKDDLFIAKTFEENLQELSMDDSTEGQKKYQETLEASFDFRTKNMVYLLGNMFFNFLTQKNLNKFSHKNSQQRNMTINFYIKKSFPNITEEETTFCSIFSHLIVRMTQKDYNLRPSPQAILSKILLMTQRFAADDHEIIAKNDWLDGYANWKKK